MSIHREIAKLRSVFGKFEEQCPLLDIGLLCLKHASGSLQVMGLRLTATSRSPRDVSVEGSSFLGVRRELPASRLDSLLEGISEGCVTLEGVDGRFPPHSTWHFSDQWWPRARDAAPKWPTVRASGRGSPFESAFSAAEDYYDWLTSFERSHDVDSIKDVAARLALDEMAFQQGSGHRASHLEVELPLVAHEVGCRGRSLVGAFMLGRGSLSATVKCFDEANKEYQRVSMSMSKTPSPFSFLLQPRNGRLGATVKVVVKDMLVWEDHVNEVDVPEVESVDATGRGGSDEVGEMSGPAFDVVLICALKTPEMEKVRQASRGQWENLSPMPGDPHTYEQAAFPVEGGREIKIVAATPNQMGPTSAAVLAAKMILRFRPKLVVLAGITAGVERDGVQMGDILVAEHTFDHASGKVKEDGSRVYLHADPQPLATEQRLLSRAKAWAANEGMALQEIRARWSSKRPRTALEVHVGPLASGSSVIAAHGPVGAVLEHWRKLIGVEMEAYGVHRACADTVYPPPLFLCAKSVCDFADGRKDDQWQEYAAFTSAEFVFAFLRKEWNTLFPAVSGVAAPPGAGVW